MIPNIALKKNYQNKQKKVIFSFIKSFLIFLNLLEDKIDKISDKFLRTFERLCLLLDLKNLTFSLANFQQGIQNIQ